MMTATRPSEKIENAQSISASANAQSYDPSSSRKANNSHPNSRSERQIKFQMDQPSISRVIIRFSLNAHPFLSEPSPYPHMLIANIKDTIKVSCLIIIQYIPNCRAKNRLFIFQLHYSLNRQNMGIHIETILNDSLLMKALMQINSYVPLYLFY